MKPTRNLIACLALASFTHAFAEDNGVAARYHAVSAASQQGSTTAHQALGPASNTQCPVMGGKVDVNSPTVAVEGRQYRLCCAECGDKVQADARHFLNKDGSLTGAWRNNLYVNYIR